MIKKTKVESIIWKYSSEPCIPGVINKNQLQLERSNEIHIQIELGNIALM